MLSVDCTANFENSFATLDYDSLTVVVCNSLFIKLNAIVVCYFVAKMQ